MSNEITNKDVEMLQQHSEKLLQKGDYAGLLRVVEKLNKLKNANTPLQDANTPLQDANTPPPATEGGRNKRGRKSKKYSKTKSKSRTRRGGRRSRLVRHRVKRKSMR